MAPYLVEFMRDGDRISATCSCAVGLLGQLCKHRFGLLAGDTSKIDVVQGAEFSLEVASWRAGTPLGSVLESMAKIEEDLARLKVELSMRK